MTPRVVDVDEVQKRLSRINDILDLAMRSVIDERGPMFTVFYLIDREVTDLFTLTDLAPRPAAVQTELSSHE